MAMSDAPHLPAHTSTGPRVAVVTGGARGIGWATVQAFVEAGVTPVLLDRDEEALAAASGALVAILSQ